MSDEELAFTESVDHPGATYIRSLEQLQELRRFSGEPGAFWQAFLRTLTMMTGASCGAVMVRTLGTETSWQLLAATPHTMRGDPSSERLANEVDHAAERLRREHVVHLRNESAPLTLVTLDTGERIDLCVAVLVSEGGDSIGAKEAERRLLLVRDIPAAYQAMRIANEARLTVERVAVVLDLMVLLNETRRFVPAAMVFCNEISARLKCERVSLGWMEHGYIRLRATSHIDRFDRKSDAVSLLEAAMEEAADQNCDVGWPESVGGAVTRDHRSFAISHDTAHVCSLPIRIEQEVIAVCTCERTSHSFTDVEIDLLRLVCDQAARRLSDLRKSDRWIGARSASALREGVGKLIGFEHTWLKLLGIILVVAAALLVFAKVPYRVTAPVALKTDEIAILSAPFAGHIQKVAARVGDEVKQGQDLLELDQTSLLLSEAQIEAQLEAYRSEAEKNLAIGALADMKIARARGDQARAQLNLVRYQISQSIIRPPFPGVVVEGDLLGRVGLPVTEGETLFKVARIAGLYAVLDVNENDIRWISPDSFGEMALASRPGEAAPISVTKIVPVAVTKNKGNVFQVNCSFSGDPQGWWRPGMTGIAKLHVGARSPLWIITHRTLDFLRLRFW